MQHSKTPSERKRRTLRNEQTSAAPEQRRYKVVIDDEPRFYAAFLLFERKLNDYCARVALGDNESITQALHDDSTRALYQQFQAFKRMFHFQQVLFDE